MKKRYKIDHSLYYWYVYDSKNDKVYSKNFNTRKEAREFAKKKNIIEEK